MVLQLGAIISRTVLLYTVVWSSNVQPSGVLVLCALPVSESTREREILIITYLWIHLFRMNDEFNSKEQ